MLDWQFPQQISCSRRLGSGCDHATNLGVKKRVQSKRAPRLGLDSWTFGGTSDFESRCELSFSCVVRENNEMFLSGQGLVRGLL